MTAYCTVRAIQKLQVTIDPDIKVVFITTATPWMGGGNDNGGRD
jgi:hypothetical protein